MELFSKQVLFRNLFAVLVFAGCLQAQTLKQIGTIDLPGPKGARFDYLTMDDEDQYLLSAHLGPGILYVIDVRTNKLRIRFAHQLGFMEQKNTSISLRSGSHGLVGDSRGRC